MAEGWHGETALGGQAHEIAVGQNEDGGLEIFYRGESNRLYHNRQTSPGSSTWGGEVAFAGDSADHICVARNQNGELELFYSGTNGVLYHNRQTSPNSTTWTGEMSFAGLKQEPTDLQSIAVAQNWDGRLQLFYLRKAESNIYNILYSCQQTAANSQTWEGGEIVASHGSSVQASAVAVGRNQDLRLQVFWTELSDNIIGTFVQTAPAGAFGERQYLANDSAKQMAAAKNADGRLELFYVGQNNDLYHNRQAGANSSTWLGETSFAGAKANQVVVAQNVGGELEIFYRGTGNHLYRNRQTAPSGSGWEGETAMGGIANFVTVGQNKDGRLEIFYAGTGDQIYHNWQTTVQRGTGPGNAGNEPKKR